MIIKVFFPLRGKRKTLYQKVRVNQSKLVYLKTCTWSFLLILLLSFLSSPVSAKSHIQTLIDEAPSGGTVTLLDHTYDEELVISKPITLIGTEYTVIRSCSEQPVIKVQANHVQLQNITVEFCDKRDIEGGQGSVVSEERSEHDHNNVETEIGGAAIFLSGDDIHLDNIHVKSREKGIQLDGARNSAISGGSITTYGLGNAIDLWESTDNVIQDVQIKNVKDGIYLDRTSRNKIIENDIQLARYGIHIMYSDNVIIQSNTSHLNFTGAMVMTSKQVQVSGNAFTTNNLNVNSQGILLYDAYQIIVSDNTINGNRVGIYMENAEANKVRRNEISNNFIGLQFNTTKGNEILENSFIGNVNTLQSVDSSENSVDRNYWDASIKLEKETEGMSLFSYQADPLYLLLTEEVPAYQLFFDSPSIKVLKALFKVPSESVMRDENPLMRSPHVYNTEGFTCSSIFKLLLGIAITTIGINLFKFRRKTL